MAAWWETPQIEDKQKSSTDSDAAQPSALTAFTSQFPEPETPPAAPAPPSSLLAAMESYRQARDAQSAAPSESEKTADISVPDRTWGELGGDILVGLGRGAHGITSGLANLADLATYGGVSKVTKGLGSLADYALGGTGEGYTLQEGSARISQALSDSESAPLQQRRQQLQQTLENVGTQGGISGGLDKFWVSAKETATDPMLLGQTAAEQVPMLFSLGLGSVGTAAKATNAARAAGATVEEAAKIGAQAVTRSNIQFSGALGAGFSSQQTEKIF